jgi:hypothetical protein
MPTKVSLKALFEHVSIAFLQRAIHSLHTFFVFRTFRPFFFKIFSAGVSTAIGNAF